MTATPPQIVVITAAGTGSRLHSDSGPPKPLLPLNGRPLILRVLDRFVEAGILEAIIVVGHRADEVREGVLADGHPARVSFVNNPRYKMSNGLSVLAAREAVGRRNFFLSMADHVFDATLIAGLRDAPLPSNGLLLAVDRKLDQIYDEDDATKVKTDGRTILEISKTLASFDAVDTGLFACTPALLDRLAEVAASRTDGDCTLSDGVKALAASGLAWVHDIGDGRWQDVDTPGAAAHAARLF
jgi:choline kinase